MDRKRLQQKLNEGVLSERFVSKLRAFLSMVNPIDESRRLERAWKKKQEAADAAFDAYMKYSVADALDECDKVQQELKSYMACESDKYAYFETLTYLGHD